MIEKYGRSPSRAALSDLHDVFLLHEREVKFGDIPRGRTVYRWNGRWYLLPDPEKPA